MNATPAATSAATTAATTSPATTTAAPPPALSAARERVSFENLVWITACLGLTLLAALDTIPLWIAIMVAGCAAMRLFLAARGRSAPPRSIRFVVSALGIGLLFLRYHTFNGLTAGTALLCLIAGLKLLETQTRRDIYVVSMIIYFLSLATLLHSESFWLLTYLTAICWLTTATLLQLTGSGTPRNWRRSIRYAARLLVLALPLAAALWLFFPRFSSPLWQTPDNGRIAVSGLSDTMNPGDITDLVMLSDEVAFRVRFSGATPRCPGSRPSIWAAPRRGASTISAAASNAAPRWHGWCVRSA